MLEYNILALGDVCQEHLRGDVALVIHGQTHSVTLCQRDAPAAEPAFGVIKISYDLAAAAVGLAAAQIVQLALYAVQQAADRLAVLSRNPALFLPEVPVSDALIVPDMQEFVSGDGYKINLDFLCGLNHSYFSLSKKVAVEGVQLGAQHHRHGLSAVFTGSNVIGSFKSISRSAKASLRSRR